MTIVAKRKPIMILPFVIMLERLMRSVRGRLKIALCGTIILVINVAILEFLITIEGRALWYHPK